MKRRLCCIMYLLIDKTLLFVSRYPIGLQLVELDSVSVAVLRTDYAPVFCKSILILKLYVTIILLISLILPWYLEIRLTQYCTYFFAMASYQSNQLTSYNIILS